MGFRADDEKYGKPDAKMPVVIARAELSFDQLVRALDQVVLFSGLENNTLVILQVSKAWGARTSQSVRELVSRISFLMALAEVVIIRNLWP